jgi:poly(A)-specific ribonuclease
MVDPDREAILQESEVRLKKKRPILLGHNMFHDLCFLHATFFGPLPDTLGEFDCTVHKLFPRIMDTKYILKRDDNETMPAKSLEEVFAEIERVAMPFTIDGEAGSLPGRLHLINEHQAGHDSYKTALVFLKVMWRQLVDTKLKSFKKHSEVQYSHWLLQWRSNIVRGFANKVRVGNAGLWDIGEMGESEA